MSTQVLLFVAQTGLAYPFGLYINKKPEIFYERFHTLVHPSRSITSQNQSLFENQICSLNVDVPTFQLNSCGDLT